MTYSSVCLFNYWCFLVGGMNALQMSLDVQRRAEPDLHQDMHIVC